MTSAQSKSKSNKLPAPVYAAAGAGDFAYQQLRKLPAVVADLRERVAGNEVDIKADVERLRAAARRNAKVVAEAGQVAQDRAVAIYKDLVSRGEHVVAGTRPPLKVKATVEVKASPALETEP
ncbi:MAG TPA: hypothetical protein VJT31_04185, partial [Rugosimonospora sp.]|nr:hypothetical protein [Rugosimonospora sp.]